VSAGRLPEDTVVPWSRAGAWGRNHVRTLHAMGSLGGVVEASRAAAGTAQGRVSGAGDLELAGDGLSPRQGVVIATPPASHANLAEPP